ncbi:hypothetical protein Asppvi_001744 [Aspergillus pseudoviridinutans]|uniref:Carboxylesterase type B domain-containing protein n=1 Tax=Aspergillus pseudoviridinutans TaxID=1517512 RepID=A0A9P3B4E7_9EURO|nr:uncharacterized protein Asppvi_001744 [Aspergillus pseudoviridinutans]GIJ83224.1 hypothetical protein Asppvi_001744 [Aspergillus pseudoviridinutans]
MHPFTRNLVLAVLSDLTLVQSSDCAPPSVDPDYGTYLGLYNQEYAQDFFLGVPYAQPPVGSLRFAAPQPLRESFDEPRNATEYGWMCIGYGSDTANLGLKLGDDLPVGSHLNGGSRDPRYNLSYIVQQSVEEKKPIVAVSINYRLSFWGFLFSKEMEAVGAGNIAFRDQRMALQWLHNNITGFSGSPDKLTIWGESAGARSLGMQLIAYDGMHDGLFRSAILGSRSPLAKFTNADGWQPYFDALVEKTGCANAIDRLDCLKHLPWKTLSAIFNGTNPLNVTAPTLSAVIDGDFMTAQASVLLKQGNFAKVALLTGNNFDEGTAYAKQGISTD